MVNWILIAIAIVALVILSIKFKEFGHKTKLTVFIVLGLLFVATVVYVAMTNKHDLTTYDGFIGLGKSYMGWVGSIFSNMGKISGFAIKQDWGIYQNVSASP